MPTGATARKPRVTEPVVPASGIARRRAAAKDEANPAYLERRREIVEAAGRVFKAKGLQGTSLGDIAVESGADRASLYYYVGNKEELFHEVVRGAAEANLARAQAIRDSEGTAPEKLRALIESLMASYAENYPILYVYIQENLSHVPEKHAQWAADMRHVNRDYEHIVIGLVEQGMSEGTIRSVAPSWIVAYGVMGMLGWTNRWFHPETSKASAQEIATAFADTVLQGLVEPTPVRRRKRA
ncbi:MAG: regulatory protein TetR [Frankiales bacterium]|jgi:AcrR family transcriptional regulator|nr:regulatory protein TetR [Frankiales bacterium]